jgi:DNA-binding transcriptional regulator YdaS (Cro superfamily)
MYDQQPSTGIAMAVKQAGTQGVLAKRLGVSQQAISLWVEQGWVPLRRAGEIEKEFAIPRARLVNPKIIELVSAQAPPSN